jgi:PII-like signaling protein
MNGLHLRLYTYEYRKHRGEPVYAWLLDQARKLGIPGGSAYRAMAGYGRHGLRHEQHFFELAGQEPVLVEFIVSAQQAEAFLAALEAEHLDLFYACLPVEYGVVGQREAPQGDG